MTTKTIHMDLGPDSYDILLERGCLARCGALLALDRKVLIVTDDGVPEAFVQTLRAQCGEPYLFVVPQGERSKNFDLLRELLQTMLRAGFQRSSCVVALGGGMVGDLAGFAAACYMRGIDFYNIPTTVLSQVDSSIGGKTAVNLDGIKNIVGAFYQPKQVLIDTETLDTLPRRQVSAGLAEAVKMALIRDGALFAAMERDGPETMLDQVIARSVELKKAVVEADEKELGLRKILNFGHTIGHGIESETDLYHGECVALGMLPMCTAPVRERLRSVLERLALPQTVRADPERVYAAVRHDKKSTGDTITVVRVETPGDCVLEDTPPERLRAAIELVVRP